MTKKKNIVKHANAQKNSVPYVVGGIILIIIVLIIIIFSGKQNKDSLATCLADKGFVMAGTSWCHFCKDQKALFKGSFEDIIIPNGAYKDCDIDSDWCDSKGITSYPSWVTPDNNIIPGKQSLASLAKISGCN